MQRHPEGPPTAPYKAHRIAAVAAIPRDRRSIGAIRELRPRRVRRKGAICDALHQKATPADLEELAVDTGGSGGSGAGRRGISH